MRDNHFFNRIVNFDILFGEGGRSGPRLDSFDEGVEFGFRNLNRGRGCIPLAFYSPARTNRDERIRIGPELSNDITIIRGYSVPTYGVGSMIVHRAELKLCGSEMIQNNASLSFRWLQTVFSDSSNNRDTVHLDNVAISTNFPEGHNIEDDFNNETMIK
jgi:hypothetical protein